MTKKLEDSCCGSCKTRVHIEENQAGWNLWTWPVYSTITAVDTSPSGHCDARCVSVMSAFSIIILPSEQEDRRWTPINTVDSVVRGSGNFSCGS